MPRYSGEDDRRRSSPYDSVRDRRIHDRKLNQFPIFVVLQYKFHGADDKRNKRKERNENRERDQYQNQNQRTDVRNYRDRRKNENYYNRPDYKSSRHYKHQYTQRSPSRSDDKSPRKAISQSNSPPCGKSTRKSGFDLAPPVATTLPNSSEQSAGVSMAPQAIAGVLQNINTSESQAHQVNLLGSFSLFPIQAMTQQATRHARRVYVGGLPPLANEQTITRFFSHIMNAVGGNSAGPGDAVVNVYINHEKKFAFVEMRTVEEASNAMALDGIVFEGVSVRVRRPTDYNPSLAAPLGPSQPSPYLNLAAAGMNEVDEADRIFLGGVPYYFSEAQIKELLESFGPLRGFGLVKDRDTGNSKGYGFCIYKDPSVTDIACAALNGLKVGDKTLTVRRTTVSGQLKSEQGNILAHAQQHIAMQKMALGASTINVPVGRMESIVHAETPTKILCLTDVITIEELMDEGEYKEILEDMRGECEKFGELIDVVIPRPNPDAIQSEGIGKVFLEYSDIAGCAKAKLGLAGRKFGGNTVVAMYYPEDRYYGGNYAAATATPSVAAA